jgi:hypothetical protein
MLDGIGYRRSLIVVGNGGRRNLWKPKRRNQTVPLVASGIDPSSVSFSHLGIVLKDVPPHSKIQLRVLRPRFGLTTTTQPPNAAIEVRKDHDFLVIKNEGETPVEWVRLRVDLPISRMWFVLSLASGVGALLALLARPARRHLQRYLAARNDRLAAGGAA